MQRCKKIRLVGSAAVSLVSLYIWNMHFLCASETTKMQREKSVAAKGTRSTFLVLTSSLVTWKPILWPSGKASAGGWRRQLEDRSSRSLVKSSLWLVPTWLACQVPGNVGSVLWLGGLPGAWHYRVSVVTGLPARCYRVSAWTSWPARCYRVSVVTGMPARCLAL